MGRRRHRPRCRHHHPSRCTLAPRPGSPPRTMRCPAARCRAPAPPTCPTPGRTTPPSRRSASTRRRAAAATHAPAVDGPPLPCAWHLCSSPAAPPLPPTPAPRKQADLYLGGLWEKMSSGLQRGSAGGEVRPGAACAGEAHAPTCSRVPACRPPGGGCWPSSRPACSASQPATCTPANMPHCPPRPAAPAARPGRPPTSSWSTPACG